LSQPAPAAAATLAQEDNKPVGEGPAHIEDRVAQPVPAPVEVASAPPRDQDVRAAGAESNNRPRSIAQIQNEGFEELRKADERQNDGTGFAREVRGENRSSRDRNERNEGGGRDGLIAEARERSESGGSDGRRELFERRFRDLERSGDPTVTPDPLGQIDPQRFQSAAASLRNGKVSSVSDDPEKEIGRVQPELLVRTDQKIKEERETTTLTA
jgi:hypothetical protein